MSKMDFKLGNKSGSAYKPHKSDEHEIFAPSSNETLSNELSTTPPSHLEDGRSGVESSGISKTPSKMAGASVMIK
jgi:hypothetical protein